MHRFAFPVVAIALVGCTNDLPSVTLDGPASQDALYADLPVEVRATINDDNHDIDELTVRWTSNLDGLLAGPQSIEADGSVSGQVRLSAGLHVLRVEVEDPRGDITVDDVAVDVAETNSAPTCAFTSPEAGGAATPGSQVTIDLAVDDVDVGPEALTLSLSSDLDGDLGALSADATGAATLTAGLSLGTHALRVTATDELGASCEASQLFTIGNPPTASILSPEGGYVQDIDELIQFTGSVADDLDAAEALQIQWSSDRAGVFSTVPATAEGALAVDYGYLGRGPHTITLRATDSLGFYAEDSVDLLINGPPNAPEISLTPEAVLTTDAPLVAITTESTDLEGDPVSYSYAWYVDEVLQPDLVEATLPAERTARDQIWRVVVTPNDGRLNGEAVGAAFTVGNSIPVLSEVALSPTEPVTNDVVTAAVVATDDDGDTIEFDYVWSVDGVATTATGPTLDGATWFDKGDTISVEVTPSDDAVSGTALASTVITAINSAPTDPVVEMDPDWTYGDEDASCLVVEASVDADGDPITYTITWDGDGTAYPSGFTDADGPDTVEQTDDTVPSDDQDLADTFTCSVTASDGTVTTTAVTAEFDVVDSVYDLGYWREFPYTSILARNYLLGHPVTVPRDVTVVELGIIAKRTTANAKIAVYTDSGGKPGTLVVGSSLQRINVGTNKFSVPATDLSAGTYWVMAVYDATAYAGEDRGRNTVYYVSMSAYGAFPTTASWRSYSGYRHNYFMTVYE